MTIPPKGSLSGSTLRYLVAAVVLLAMLPALGCSTTQTTTRSLTSRESHKLIASQAWSVPEESQKLEAQDPAKLEKHGDQLASAGDWNAALFQYNRALSLNPGGDNGRLQLKIAHSYLRGKQWLEAEASFSMLAKDMPDNPAVWQGLGMALMARNEAAQAEEALNKALKLRPDAWVALQGLGILHNWQGKPEKAIPFFQKAVKIKPENPAIHNNLGLSHLMAGQFAKAVDCFKRALELNPDYTLAANNLGLAYAGQNRMDSAMEVFQRSLGPAKAANNLGVLMAWKGDKQGAAVKFQEAMRTSPSHYELATRHLSLVQ